MNILVSKDGDVELLSALPVTSTLSIQSDNNKPQQNYLANLIKLGLMGASLLTLPLSGYAAVSATTSKTIQGTAPYLTFDGGTTKVTTTDALLGITLSDGTPAGTTTYTKSTNTSSLTNPIQLPVAGQTFEDVQMLVPTTATGGVETLTNIFSNHGYWGDDDGDGLGAGGISATGTLKVEIKDKYGQAVNRSDTVEVCKAPYEVKLTSTAGTLKTQYGDPRQSNFTSDNTTYYINPKSPPIVCFAKPDNSDSSAVFAGPVSMWNPTRGFIPQSTTPATYGSNFPTTGANNFSFELDIGAAPGALNWTTVKASGTAGDIAATPSACTVPKNYCVKYTLTGPAPTPDQRTAASPGLVTPAPTLNTDMVLEGQTGGTTLVAYGFKIKRWFIGRGTEINNLAKHTAWCTDAGYRMPGVGELTNAQGEARGMGGTLPPHPQGSNDNVANYWVGAGLISEWGGRPDKYNTDFTLYKVGVYMIPGYYTSTTSADKGYAFTVGWSGVVDADGSSVYKSGICVHE